jgi:beta-barrel assembly-enhancing protease
MKTTKILFAALIAFGSLMLGCKKDNGDGSPEPVVSGQVTTSCTDVNVFSIQRDMDLGAQVDAEIRSDKVNYPVLDSAANANNAWAYQYLYKIRDSIFAKSNVDYENTFKWKIAIIKDDSVLNAFCTPGGYIFVYTGIIKFLDNEDDFAGVLGHEIGHAALRHSTDGLLKQNGLSYILSALGGDSSRLAQIAASLVLLKYSRCHETQSDEYSVAVLKNSKYKCNGAASFFQKIGSSGTPAFLSTHPDPGDRVVNINAHADKLGCNKTVAAPNTKWAELKTKLGL